MNYLRPGINNHSSSIREFKTIKVIIYQGKSTHRYLGIFLVCNPDLSQVASAYLFLDSLEMKPEVLLYLNPLIDLQRIVVG